MEGYSVTINFCSKELTVREKIRMKDLTNAVQLDEVTQALADKLIITPAYYAELSVHNEKSESKDYNKFILVDDAGTKYVTGSESFRTAFIDIYSEMIAAGETEPYDIEVYRMESKNYKGKSFITCSIV